MADRPMISSGTLGRGHRLAAGSLTLLVLTMCAATVPFGRTQLPGNASFLPAFGALTLLSELLTAALLVSQATVARDRAPLRLGAAYLFSALALLPHMMAFPGVFAASPPFGGRDAAVWLWTFWHGGLAAWLVWSVLRPSQPLRRGDVLRTVATVCFVVFAGALALTLCEPWLPTLLVDGNYHRLNTLGIGPAVLGLTSLALALVVFQRRLQDPLSLWMAVSLLAAVLDVSLTLFSGGRFTFGWYVARLLSLLTGVTMLIALLSELIRQARRVADVNAQLEQMLGTDSLTGLRNRRSFETSMEQEWRRGRRDQTALSLLMIDIDVFKGYNDRYGHPAGDACLRRVAVALDGQVQRPADLVARLGGEEFVILLPGTEEAGAAQVAERVRAAVADLAIEHGGSLLGEVTISVGVATRRPADWSAQPAELVNAADRALYQAKGSGRNLVCVEQKAPPPLARVAA